ncbi:MAG: hypothetical protein KGH94_00035 [Candidatus Micrarchaeota archaeon]|nr:hypothetical protein [Candidatus Micrarchaeota archaeon]
MANTKSWIAILMGVIILIADVYWTYTSYYDIVWVILGVVIFVADIIWLLIDWSFMKH